MTTYYHNTPDAEEGNLGVLTYPGMLTKTQSQNNDNNKKAKNPSIHFVDYLSLNETSNI